MKNGIRPYKKLKTSSKDKTLGLIYQLPDDLKIEIGKILDLSSLENMHFVDKSWYLLVQQICHHWIERYFPYLKAKQTFGTIPLKLLTQEFQKYENLIAQYTVVLGRKLRVENNLFSMSIVLAALAGNKEAVATATANGLIKRQACFLYALLVMNGHRLPALLACGIKKNEVNGLALWISAEFDYLAAVKHLLAEDGISNSDKGLAFVCAAQSGHLSIVKHFLATDTISYIYLEAGFGNAAIHGQLEVIKYLLATVNFLTNTLERTLKDAIRLKRHKVAQEIENKLYPNIKNISKTFTPLHAAISYPENEEEMAQEKQNPEEDYSCCKLI